jgi:hypothetical protein
MRCRKRLRDHSDLLIDLPGRDTKRQGFADNERHVPDKGAWCMLYAMEAQPPHGAAQDKDGFANSAAPGRRSLGDSSKDDRSLLEAALGDGRFLIALTGFCVALSGLFAVLQSRSGHLLPQDSDVIGMDAAALARVANEHLVGFMFHDRVAYGGAMLSIGLGYMWLAAFPMAGRVMWAWQALAISGGIGFSAFLTYLGKGYLDTWHGVATLVLFPVFAAGLWRSRPQRVPRYEVSRRETTPENVFAVWGRRVLGACGAGMVLAGATIAVFGMTTVFVPSDLAFIGLDPTDLQKISPMLIPLISHDRAGFGGGLCSLGVFLLFVARHAEITRSLVEIVALMGCVGFGCAIGVHFVVGYTDFLHLLPAFVGFALFLVATGLLLTGWMKMRFIPETRRPF